MNALPALKRCSRCKEYKPRDAYYPNATMADRLQGYCIVCAKNYAGEHSERRSQLERAMPALQVAGARVQSAVALYDKEAVKLGEQLHKLREAALRVAEEVESAKAIVREALR